ncbi:MAG: hypothetical protein M5U33_03670 [Pseudorhodoplanes sp.]|nr:hypothetical protein [Pseudorhodoplanes sp.]
MMVVVDDAGEMRRGCRRVFQEAQRDPAGGEMSLDLGVLLFRLDRLARDPVGGPGVADIEQLAREQAALGPPFVGIDDG